MTARGNFLLIASGSILALIVLLVALVLTAPRWITRPAGEDVRKTVHSRLPDFCSEAGETLVMWPGNWTDIIYSRIAPIRGRWAVTCEHSISVHTMITVDYSTCLVEVNRFSSGSYTLFLYGCQPVPGAPTPNPPYPGPVVKRTEPVPAPREGYPYP